MTNNIDYYMKLNWTYRFEWSIEDECYIANIAELKGCVADGETIEEATKEIKDALASYIAACLEAGYKIPEPLKPSDFKGQIPYRTTSEKHYKLAQKAKITGKSINSIIDEATDMFLRETA